MSKVFQYKLSSNPKEIFGNKTCTINVSLKNLTSDTVYIEPLNLNQFTGKILDTNATSEDTALDTLEKQKIELISELELIIKKIFLAQVIKEEEEEVKEFSKSLSKISKIISTIRIDNLIEKTSYQIYKTFKRLPEHIDKATQINDLSDLEIIEETISETDLPENSTLKKTFTITKQKLIQCTDGIRKLEKLDDNERIGLRYIKVPSKGDILFMFKIRMPIIYKEQNSNFIFLSKVIDKSGNVVETVNIEKEFDIYPSAFSVPTGAILGASVGYTFKVLTQNYTSDIKFIPELIGCAVLAFIFSLLVRKMPKKKKIVPFTVEDFMGGIILGFLIGLFTDNFLEYLEGLVPNKN